MPTESSPASRSMPTEIIPELLVLPVMANEATLKQSVVTVSSMDDAKAIPAPQAAASTLPYSTIFKPPLFKPVNTPRYTT